MTTNEQQIDIPTACNGCTSCCQHMGHPLLGGLADPPDPAWLTLPQELKDEVLEHIANLDTPLDDWGMPCIWVGPNGCRHYEHRPRCCREWEVGGEDCLECRADPPDLTGVCRRETLNAIVALGSSRVS